MSVCSEDWLFYLCLLERDAVVLIPFLWVRSIDDSTSVAHGAVEGTRGYNELTSGLMVEGWRL